jgi:hypothetical protein
VSAGARELSRPGAGLQARGAEARQAGLEARGRPRAGKGGKKKRKGFSFIKRISNYFSKTIFKPKFDDVKLRFFWDVLLDYFWNLTHLFFKTYF